MSVKMREVSEPLEVGEGVHWDSREQVLYYVNVIQHSILKYDPATGISTSTKVDGHASFFVPVEGVPDQFVVGLENKIVLLQWDGKDKSPAKVVKELAEVGQDAAMKMRLNDGKVDPRGRLFAGTMPDVMTLTTTKTGSLYRQEGTKTTKLEKAISISNGLSWDLKEKAFYYTDSMEHNIRRYDYDVETGDICTMPDVMTLTTTKTGSLYRQEGTKTTKLEKAISISNGLSWDLKEKAFYYTDSMEHNIRRYDYDVETGDISNLRYVFDFKENGIEGAPDGHTIDTDGNLWIAVFGGSCVLQVDPRTGKLLRKLPIPAVQVTSVTFGGPNLDILYVTTAAKNFTGGQDYKYPGGCTFEVTGLGAKGHPNRNFKL